MIKGKCNCGEVSFQANIEIQDIYVCHCSICRRSTGSNGIPAVIVKKKKFEWLSGTEKITKWIKPEGSWERQFCKVCGSPLPDFNDNDSMYIPAGVITEGGNSLEVAHHIWVNSKAEWDKIGDSGKLHPESFGS